MAIIDHLFLGQSVQLAYICTQFLVFIILYACMVIETMHSSHQLQPPQNQLIHIWSELASYIYIYTYICGGHISWSDVSVYI